MSNNLFGSSSNNNSSKHYTAITARVRSDNDPYQYILGQLNIIGNKIENIKQITGSNYGLVNCNIINGVKEIKVEDNLIKNLQFNSIGETLVSTSNNGWNNSVFNINTKSIIRNNIIDSLFFNNNYLSQSFSAINTTSYICEITGNNIKNLFFKGTNGTVTLLSTYHQVGGQALIKKNLFTNIKDSTIGLNFNVISCSNNGTNSELSDNSISDLNLNSFDDIYLISVPVNLISNNRIYNIENRGVGGIIGLHCGNSNNTYISNNIIANLNRSNNSNGTTIGILLGGQAKNYITNNTILINDFNNSKIKGISLNNGINSLKNNLISIGSSTNNKAMCLYGYGVIYYDSLSGNNLFYAGIPDSNHLLFEDAGNSYVLLSDLKNYLLSINAEQNSVTENVVFIDTIGNTPFFLKPDTTIPTLAESNGQVISSLQTDIANNIRYGNNGYTGSGFGTDIGAWEFEGKAINFCTGAPNAGIANVYHIPCTNKISMSLDSNSQNGNIKYQWQRSPDSMNLWVNLNNNNLDSFVYEAPLGSNAYYRCITTCVLSGLSDTSTISNKIHVEQFNPQGNCYCPSIFTSTTGADIGQVKFGALLNPIQNIAIQTNDTSANKKYSNFTNLTAKRFNQGQYYPISIKQITSSATLQSAYLKVFIDYNHNNSFADSSEQVVSRASNSSNSFTVLDSILIPLSATIGKTRMRVILQQGGSSTMTSCQNATIGETEDYVIEILPPCSNTYVDLVTPNEGGNIGDVTVNLYGGCFKEGSIYKLIKGSDTLSISDTMINYYSNSHVGLVLELQNADTGYYSLLIIHTDSSAFTLNNAFLLKTVEYGGYFTNYTGPTNIRPNTWNNFNYSIYSNSNIDINAIPLIFLFPEHAEINFNFKFLKPNNYISNLDSIPKTIIVDKVNGVSLPHSMKAVPIFIPKLPPNSSVNLNFSVRGTNFDPDHCLLDFAQKYQNNVPISLQTFGCWLETFAQDLGLLSQGITGLKAWAQVFGMFSNMINDAPVEDYVVSFMDMAGEKFEEESPGSPFSFQGVHDFIEEAVNPAQSYTDCAKNWIKNTENCPNIVASVDPNNKYGPLLFGSNFANYFSPQNKFFYLINYENDSSATAPAQVVTILDTLDTNVFELSSFQLGNFTIGDSSFSIPNGLKAYHTQIDLSAKGMFYAVDVDAKLNDTTGVVSWTFTTLDLNTLLPATGVFDGFLPPNINSPQGQGSVSFSIKVKDSIANNTAINNSAAIYFDNNAPIITPTWLNTIDDEKPISNVLALSNGCDSIFTVSWNGTDSQAGIAGYDVYFSVNGNSSKPLISNTSLTTFTFTGNYDSTYSFYSIAKDKAGNIEDAPITFDASTTIKKAKCNLVVDSFATCNIYINTSLYDTIGNVGFLWYRDSVLLPYTTPNVMLPLGSDTSKVYCKISFCNFGVSYSDTLTIPKMQTYYDSSSAQICLGQSFNFYGNTYTSGGTYSEVFNTMYGCDSIKTVNLTVNPTSHDTINANICNGQSYSYNGNNYTSSGYYTNPFINMLGCDSTKTIYLTVNPITLDTMHVSICNGQSYTFNGNNYSAEGYFSNTFQSIFGCDSIRVIHLTFNPSNSDTLNAVICNGETYPFNGNNYNSQGFYANSFTNTFGCDSIVTVSLLVNSNPIPILIFNGTSLITSGGYQSYSWYQNGNVIITNIDSTCIVPSNGTYKVEVIDSNGCVGVSDSIIVNSLSVSDISNSQFDISVYPNPASSYLNILVKNKLTCNATFVLYDQIGNKIISKNLDKKEIVSIPIYQVLNGEYNYIFICDGQRIERGKLIFKQ